GGNCYPFMCNDSESSTGQSIDYQQVFAPSAFSGTTTVNSITWYFTPVFPNSYNAIGGTYDIYLGYFQQPGGWPLHHPVQQRTIGDPCGHPVYPPGRRQR